jgi:hypothetical protein
MKTTSIRSRLVWGIGLIILFFLLQGALVWWFETKVRGEVVSVTAANTKTSSQLAEVAVLAL